MDVIDLRAQHLHQAAFDAHDRSGAAAAFAFVAFLGCCLGTLAGALVL